MSSDDSNVIGYYEVSGFDDGVGDVEGYDDVGDIEGYDEVGRRRRRRRAAAPQTQQVPNLSLPQIAALAKHHGHSVVPMNRNHGGAHGVSTGRALLPSSQRRQPCGFSPALNVAPGVSFLLEAKVQKGFQLERLIADAVHASGADATGVVEITSINVGQRNQMASEGSIPLTLFAADAVGVSMLFDPAKTGNTITIRGEVSSTAAGPVSVRASGIGYTHE